MKIINLILSLSLISLTGCNIYESESDSSYEEDTSSNDSNHHDVTEDPSGDVVDYLDPNREDKSFKCGYTRFVFKEINLMVPNKCLDHKYIEKGRPINSI